MTQEQGMTEEQWRVFKYFKPYEFKHPFKMEQELISKLNRTRHYAEVPIHISSDYRPGDKGSHGLGLAVDIKDDPDHDGITSRWRFKVVSAALEVGFTRIGVYDKHIHLDIWEKGPQGVLWIGKSR